MVPNAGSIVSIDMATSDVVKATSAMNSTPGDPGAAGASVNTVAVAGASMGWGARYSSWRLGRPWPLTEGLRSGPGCSLNDVEADA